MNQGGSIILDILNFVCTTPLSGDSKSIELWTIDFPLCISLSLFPGNPPQGSCGMIYPIAAHSFIATVPYSNFFDIIF